MTRHPLGPGQAALFDFGPVAVHLARRTWPGTCAECRASLTLAAEWGTAGGCHDCPGTVRPARPGALLTADETPAELKHLEAA